jgi:hypothetical protein
MEMYSFLTFLGGILVGVGMGMLLMALAAVIWGRYGDTRR